ncbi:hypothetical protein [Arthrobacter sp. 135MFCol5.1]|uniref:hypothetical protein n=1 Tax=Arthrobacter sp. 135MFCol5.1 TaxID=1158050 RepID=UPI00039D3FEB|nr:hypothetical protein [Arthrobacter sp. 135MFCol5.1]
MPYVLEYATSTGAGRVTMHGMDFTDVLPKAKKVLRGLDCTRAVLRHSADTLQVFGRGSILAAYTQEGGWVCAVSQQDQICSRQR